VAAEAGRELGAGAGKALRKLWRKLRPALDDQGGANQAVEEALASPTDESAVDALAAQIRAAPESRPQLARTIEARVRGDGNVVQIGASRHQPVAEPAPRRYRRLHRPSGRFHGSPMLSPCATTSSGRRPEATL
jgi:hypothetical protein